MNKRILFTTISILIGGAVAGATAIILKFIKNKKKCEENYSDLFESLCNEAHEAGYITSEKLDQLLKCYNDMTDDEDECDDDYTVSEAYVKDTIPSNSPLSNKVIQVGMFDGESVKEDMDVEDIEDCEIDYDDDEKFDAFTETAEGQKLIGQGETLLGLKLLVIRPEMSLDVKFKNDDMILYNGNDIVTMYDYNEDQYKFILDKYNGKLYGYSVSDDFMYNIIDFIKRNKPIVADLTEATNNIFLDKLKITDYDEDEIDKLDIIECYDYHILMENYNKLIDDEEITSRSTFPIKLK